MNHKDEDYGSEAIAARPQREKKCPKCYKPTLKKGIQTTLEGEEIPFVYCNNPNCDYQQPRLELKF